MLFRPPAAGPSSADRIAALLPCAPSSRDGWVPPQDGPGCEVDVSAPQGSGSAPVQADRVGAQEPVTAHDSVAGADVEAAPEDVTASRRADAPQHVSSPESDPEPPPAVGLLLSSGPPSWSGGGRHVDSGLGARLRVLPSRSAVLALVVVAVVAAVVAAAVVLRGRPQEVVVPAVEAAGVPLPGVSAPAEAAASGEVVVAVAGTVHRPGLVRLPAGSRVDDAVRAAGGPVAGASTGLLNLARRLVDGEQVLVGVAPPPGAPATGPAATGGAAGGPALLDLNAATVADLDALPGIGPVLAQRIVDWRTENARFASVDQLREVTGIGEAKYADLRAKVTV